MDDLKGFFGVFRLTLVESVKNRVAVLSAALSFYLLFSIGPLMLILFNVMGYIFNVENPRSETVGFLQKYMLASGANMFRSIGENYQLVQGNAVITIGGIAILLWTATRVFNHLQHSMNEIWGVDSKRSVKSMVKKRVFSFALILALGTVIFLLATIQGLLSEFNEFIQSYYTPDTYYLSIVSSVLNIFVTASIFSFLFKYLPDTRVPVESAFLGGFTSSILFFTGQSLATYYFSLAGIASAYGAAGSLVVLLLWVYYSSQIFFIGAQFTKIHSEAAGAG